MLLNVILKFRKYIKRKYYTFFALRKLKSYKETPYINGKTKFTKNTILGHNCHFNGLDIRGAGLVSIGDNFHSGDGCLFITDIHNYKGSTLPYDDTYIIKNIVIEDNVWLGTNVTILGGVTIKEGAIIQAGSVVVSDIPKYAIAGGHPAIEFSQRDLSHYIELKEKKLFY